MSKILLMVALTVNCFLGVAESEHFLNDLFSDGGYYIEETLNIHKDDTVLVIEEEIFVVNCPHQEAE